MKKRDMKMIRRYVRDKRGSFALFFLCTGLYLTLFWLYRLPLEAVIYGTVLCLCAGAAAVCLDYSRVRKKYAALSRIKNALQEGCDLYQLEEFPTALNELEREYQRLLLQLCECGRQREAEFQAERGDMQEYYAMWVHQIKTPIAAMRLLLQTEEERKSAELSEQLFKIEEYVDMVLQYLRLDGGSDLLIKDCDLDEIVRQAVRKYAGLFIKKKLSLTYEPLNCQVLTDEKWLVFVMEQILSNALKYTKKGGIAIYLEPGREKVLVIEDTGIGIAGEDLPRIFEMGFTGGNGRTHKKSTGIGLYLCRRILKKLSHSIEAESEIGEGTKLRLCLDTRGQTVE